MTFLLIIAFVIISVVCTFVFIYVSTFYAIIAGLQCISMLPALSSCKVLVFVVFCKFLTVFILKKSGKTKTSYITCLTEPEYPISSITAA